MPAMIERHLKDGKPAPSNIPAKETIPCAVKGCEFAYTISYSEEESLLNGFELNVLNMRRLAVELIDKAHPVHRTKKHIWEGAENGWFEADSTGARKVL